MTIKFMPIFMLDLLELPPDKVQLVYTVSPLMVARSNLDGAALVEVSWKGMGHCVRQGHWDISIVDAILSSTLVHPSC